MLAPMTIEAADWVYREVLTKAYRRSVGAESHGRNHDLERGTSAVRTCPCQYGPCGHCARGRHGDCAHHDWQPPPSCAAYVQDRRGGVVAEMWLTGKACAWRCSCVCKPPPAWMPAVEQLDLFTLIGGDA